MKRLYVFLTTLIVASVGNSAHANNMVRVKALGSSPRGQFVAFEEFGYKNGRKIPFSKIRIMNMWKNKYADKPIQVLGKRKEINLEFVREKAKRLAIDRLKKFNITI